MAYTTLLEMHLTSNPNPPSINPTTSSSSSSSSLQTLDSNTAISSLQQFYSNPTNILGVASGEAFQYSSASAATYPLGLALSYAQPNTIEYYLDPTTQTWVAKLAVQQYGSDPAAVGATIPSNGTEQLTIAYPSVNQLTNLTVQSLGNGTWKKRPKKIKVVQSAYCAICKVDCNSKDVFDKHKLGKKHRKNVEKLQGIAVTAASGLAGLSKPIIGPPENPNKGTVHGRKKTAEPMEDLETKRRKIVQGGAAVEAVRMCNICNVVCNSEKVFIHHLSGQKHAAMVKKHVAGIGVATAIR